jgi:hypothetical protein
MYDFSFDQRSLEREFLRSDFLRRSDLMDQTVRDPIVSSAVREASIGFPYLRFDSTKLRGKPVYQLNLLSHDLILRKLSRNIRVLTRVKQADRETIVKSLISQLSEGVPFRVYKLDIRQYYESFDFDALQRRFSNDPGFPPSSYVVLDSLNRRLREHQIVGLPRGLALSATLSEYAMRPFDRAIRAERCVTFYARFVDDIIIVTTGSEDERKFLRSARRKLPTGLEFSQSKSSVTSFSRAATRKNACTVEDTVDFLGYRFSVSNPIEKDGPDYRNVTVDISPSKVRRLKSRIVLASMEFIRDNSYADLLDRLKLITGNYNMYDFDKSLSRNMGIYYNYRHAGSSGSAALAELDDFLRRFLLSQTGRIAATFYQRLSMPQRRELMKLCFTHSFNERTFYNFNASRLATLVGCWKRA